MKFEDQTYQKNSEDTASKTLFNDTKLEIISGELTIMNLLLEVCVNVSWGFGQGHLFHQNQHTSLNQLQLFEM